MLYHQEVECMHPKISMPDQSAFVSAQGQGPVPIDERINLIIKAHRF